GQERQPPFDINSLPQQLGEAGLSRRNYGCKTMPHLCYVQQHPGHTFPSDRFVEDARSGDLPSVAWLDAPVRNQNGMVATDMRWTAAQVDAIVADGLWPRTAIFI